jgi:acetyl esterase/lipase
MYSRLMFRGLFTTPTRVNSRAMRSRAHILACQFTCFILTLATCLLTAQAMAQLKPANEPLDCQGNMRTYVFKSTPQDDPTIDVFLPPRWKIGQKNPAIVMEHGSGGDKKQFRTKADYLASRGMVALVGEYGRTVRTKDKTNDNSVEDCKSTIRWIRINAKVVGIDPNRVVGAGCSAGAAVCFGLLLRNWSLRRGRTSQFPVNRTFWCYTTQH